MAWKDKFCARPNALQQGGTQTRVSDIDMRYGRKVLIIWFAVFGVMSLIAVFPPAAATIALIMGAAPFFLVVASPTILLYSAALVPLWLASTAPHRRIGRVASAIALPIALAIVPGLLSQNEAKRFVRIMGSSDFHRPAPAKPRSIELQGDDESGMFAYEDQVGDERAPCGAICLRLLFSGEAEQVRMTRLQESTEEAERPYIASVIYRIEQRASCPQAYRPGVAIDKGVRERLLSGDCLIVDTSGSNRADATVMFTTRRQNRQSPLKLPDAGPKTAAILAIKELRITNRQSDPVPVLLQTRVDAGAVVLPFYFVPTIASLPIKSYGVPPGWMIIAAEPIDLAQALRDTFGYSIAELPAPTPEDERSAAERILALSPSGHPTLSGQQQDALYGILAAIAKQPALSDADVTFVGEVIADMRISDTNHGAVIQAIFRQFAARLVPLIPAVLDRMNIPVPERTGQFKSLLGSSLAYFSADLLQPYRDKMIAIVEGQPDWPANDILERLAELGGDEATSLVIKRLDSNTGKRSAAIAACRASAGAWPALEPAVLAHLTPSQRGNRLADDEPALLLALVRFGKKQLVIDMLETRDLLNKDYIIGRLSQFETGFGAQSCREML